MKGGNQMWLVILSSVTASKEPSLCHFLLTANNKLCEMQSCKHSHPPSPSDAMKTWRGPANTTEQDVLSLTLF